MKMVSIGILWENALDKYPLKSGVLMVLVLIQYFNLIIGGGVYKGEMLQSEKDAISHRGESLRILCDNLRAPLK